MAQNFQPHMGGGPGQMMQQQRPPQQRPPQGAPNATQQIQQLIYQTVTQQTGPITGWQTQVLIQERIGLIFNIIGNLRLASQNQANAPPLNKMIEIGIKFEKEIYETSTDKAHYRQQVEQKLQLLLERRNQNQAGLQHNINQQAQTQAQQQAQQQMMMNQNGMQGQPPRSMPQQPAQQGFQHLQHQMQASPLPGQQPQQTPMGMGNGGMPQNMIQNQQQQFQQNNLNRQAANQITLTPQETQLCGELANRLMSQAPVEEKNQLRHRLVSTMAPQQLNDFQMRGHDPLVMYYRQQAMARIRADKQARMLAMSQQNPNMPNVAPPMQQQRSGNPNLTGQTQPPGTMGGNGDQFGNFMGNNMDNINAQQQQGVIAAGEGQVVVPATGPRNATPQPGGMVGQMGMNTQQGMANPNQQRTQQQQQQLLNAQQLQQQQQRLHAQQQQQRQQATQLDAQTKQQQQINLQGNLQGQRDIMGNGPMPPQQSPAMPNLNTPIRPPSQMSHPEVPQSNPTPQFGNPQFNQGNPQQRLMGDPRLNHPMFQGMNNEQRQKVAALPPDKLNEILAKWNEQRQMNTGRQMGNQGNGPMHPGQQMPGQQFNGPNAMNQFGQRPNQPMQNPMTQQQQQQAMLQNQMMQMTGQQQRPGMPINQQQVEMQVIRQMDTIDFPINFQNHGSFPRNVPPEIKKWGQLKMWAQQNPSMGNEIQDSIKQLQKIHWQSIMRSKQQALQQAGGIPPGGLQSGGLQPGSNPMSSMPPGMGGAPVAPMGTGSMVPPAGPPIRQPTQQEIQNARNHPSGKMAAASDDQIRIFLIRQQALARQQQQSQMQNITMQNQIASINQSRQGQQQVNPNIRAPNQPPQAQQAKPAPPNAEAANAQNANRASRPAANAARNAPPSSSPAQPPKNNLKRAQSDDVIEVPNPNIQQPSRPAAQPQGPKGQIQQQIGQQARPPSLTPQQVASLDPEARKRYEASARLAQGAARLQTIMREETEKAEKEPYIVIPMTAEEKLQVTASLRSQLLQPLNNMVKALPRWYQITKDDERVRTFCALKHRLAKQFHDEGMRNPKDNLSIGKDEIDVARNVLNGMVNDLSTRYPNMLNKTKGPQGNQPAPTQTAAQTSQHAAAPTVPLNAANLQEQQQQLSKLHQRTGSRSSHAPAAPTSSQPPFQFGAKSPPPDGKPIYGGNNHLTQDNLHIPPARKKQRQNHGQATPGSNSSPQVAKAPSPAPTKQQVKPRTQTRPTLCCKETDCDRHNVGFETEEELKAHTEEEHVKPLSDPTQYAQQNLASLLGLDSQGHAKKQVMPQEQPAPAPAPKMMSSGSKQGQTPNMKAPNTPAAAAATPMNRQISMNRQGSGPGARPGTPSKATPSKDSAKPAPGQDQVKRAGQPPQEMAVEDPWANTTIDPNDLFQAFQTFESGAGGAISDMSVYSSITPNDTPESSKDGVSEPNSDISDGVNLDISIDLFDEKWMPFGPSETDTLFDMNNFGMNKEEDVMMFDEQQSGLNFQWDDVVDQSAFDKPFAFDTSLYSMDAN